MTRLADVAAEVPQMKIESAMNVTGNTRNLVAGLFTKIYENMYYDAAREKYTNQIDAFLKFVNSVPKLNFHNRVAAILSSLVLLALSPL